MGNNVMVQEHEIVLQDEKLVEWLQEIFPECPEVADELAQTFDENTGRISRAYRSLLQGYKENPQDILKVVVEIPARDYTGLVSSVKIPFLSLCAHHFLPFFGTVDIVYEPGPYIIGIGKMPRLVACRAKRFQLQETLVKQLCEDMMNVAHAKGVYVRSIAQHTCVCYRGPEAYQTANQTSYAMGSLSGTHRLQELSLLLSQNM